MNHLSPYIETLEDSHTPGLIGDLDGNYDNMITHLLNVRAINYGDIGKDAKIPIWTAGHMKVIFSGDILADRKCDGFQILLALSELRRQAQEAGGDITVLAGNHEERMIGYLTGRYDHKRWEELLGSNGDHIGMTELEGFLYEADNNLIGKERRLKILQNMREDAIGNIILQEICKIKLFHIDGIGIHFHTQPSRSMLDSIENKYKSNNKNLKDATDVINNTWKVVLTRILLLGTGKINFLPIYNNFAQTFLHPLNGTEKNILPRIRTKEKNKDKKIVEPIPEKWLQNITPVDHPTYGYMRDAGISFIYHGHTNDTSLKIEGIDVVNLNRRSMGGKLIIPKETRSKILQVTRSIMKILPGK